MDAKKIIYRCLLGVAAIVLAYLCVHSVMTPIRFEEKREIREQEVIKNLVHIRTAQNEFKLENGRYAADLDSLVLFLKTTPKKEVYKQGSLTDKQLENGLTEHKAAKIMEQACLKARIKEKIEDEDALYEFVWANDKTVIQNNLQGFRRDTIRKNMIETLFKGEFTEENIDHIIYIPFSNGQKFEIEVNNEYTTSQGIRVPVMEVRAHYNSYLGDLDKQELVNLVDKETKLEHYPGLKIGDIMAPNNNAGNWE